MSLRPWQTYMIRGVASWSRWFNVDTPFNGMEEETLHSVRQREVNMCSGGNVTGVECREVGATPSFSHLGNYLDNTLLIPCNQTGLICRDRDQPARTYCRDYEIRFRCQESGVSHMSYFGGYVSLGIGFLLIIFFICVLIAHLKEKKCRNRQNESLENSNSEPDHPPTYEMLFGELGNVPSVRRQPAQRQASRMDIQSDDTCSTISREPVDDPSVFLLDGDDGTHNDRVGAEESHNHVHGRRIIGMHPVPSPPPPSYSEALTILSIATGSKDINLKSSQCT